MSCFWQITSSDQYGILLHFLSVPPVRISSNLTFREALYNGSICGSHFQLALSTLLVGEFPVGLFMESRSSYSIHRFALTIMAICSHLLRTFYPYTSDGNQGNQGHRVLPTLVLNDYLIEAHFNEHPFSLAFSVPFDMSS